MSSYGNHHDSHEDSEYKELWLDKWWPALVISYGVIFILTLAHWKPAY